MTVNLLIVDDSIISRRMLKGCLPKDREFSILEAGNGKEGLDMFKEHNPDLTLMDLSMPVMSGEEALKAMKEHSPEAHVVIISADIQIKKFNLVMSLGASMMINKPISAEKIAKVLEHVKI